MPNLRVWNGLLHMRNGKHKRRPEKMNKKLLAQILGVLLIITPLVVMYVINPITGKSMTWAQVPGLGWVIFGTLAGLGIGSFMAARDVKKNSLVFATIFWAMLLHVIAHFHQMYGPEMAHLGLDVTYNAIQGLLALWLWKAK